MRILILDTDYPAFLNWLYGVNPDLSKKPFLEQQRIHEESCFGMAGFCASNLRGLGHQAQDLHVNNEVLQRQWALEHGVRVGSNREWKFRLRRGIIPWVSLIHVRRWFYEILAAQIKEFKPDIVLNLAMDGVSSAFIREMKPYAKLMAGQIAAYIPPGENWGVYDLIISSLPNFVDHFRRLGVRSEFNRLAFEPSVLQLIDHKKRDVPISFIGSFTSSHSKRDQLLERLCATLPINIWGIGIERLPTDSPIHSRYRGAAWGLDMFRILATSKIVINYHSDVAQSYANNMRLYEATGTGALLVTDAKANLHEMFEPGKEVISYRDVDECVALIQYYLGRDEEREAIALSGQRRTLESHTYLLRMRDLCGILQKYL